MNAREVAKIIATSNFTLEELRMLNNAIQGAYSNLNRSTIYTFREGDKVLLDSNKTGKVPATIIKINRAKIKVKTESGTIWNCPPSLLTLVS